MIEKNRETNITMPRSRMALRSPKGITCDFFCPSSLFLRALCGKKTFRLICLLITAYCLLTSCKSTSRTSGTSLTTGSSTTETTFSADTFRIGNATFQSLTTSITRSTPTVVTVNGREEVVTETITETQTAVIATQTDSSATRIDSNILAARDTTAYVDTLSRDTEGMPVISDIAEGLSKGIFSAIFGKTGKFIVSLILLVIFVILLMFVFKKKQKEE